jgi:phosphate starvation-inducible PhoH-like protein
MSGNQGGKALKSSEPVLTPCGWVAIGDLEIGEQVYGEDGEICSVVGVYPQGMKDIYTVSFDDGASIECSLDHLWSVIPRRWQRSKRKVMTTGEIIDRGFKPKQRVIIPVVKPVIFREKTVLIDPYTLGALIGNRS